MRREVWREHERRNQTTEITKESEDKKDQASVVMLPQAKKQREKKRYADLVMKTYRDMEHADKREFLERKSAVERASRQRL